MSVLEEIKKPVETELARYEQYLYRCLESEHQMTSDMLSYIFESRGKALRPLMALLCASLFSKTEQLPEESLVSAMLVEMMHTASLVHDDVVDESYMRRGKPSVKALWKSHRAVLIGDYILAKSFAVAMKGGFHKISEYVVASMGHLCEGELLQSDQSDKLEMSREIYDNIIYSKTASLISTSCMIGAMSVGAPRDDVDKLGEFGTKLGMAFQIKDDMLDYTSSEKTGKPLCGDIKERKINLPLLMVLENSSPKEKAEITALLSDVKVRPENVGKIYDIVIARKGVEMALAEMSKYIDEALAILSGYPDSPYLGSLVKLCGYVSDREL